MLAANVMLTMHFSLASLCRRPSDAVFVEVNALISVACIVLHQLKPSEVLLQKYTLSAHQ